MITATHCMMGATNAVCTVWGETTNLNLEKLCELQMRAARIILNAKYDIPSLQLFKKLGWLSIDYSK